MGMTAAERQQRYRERRLAEIAAMPKIACVCGCGTLIPPFTKELKPARYARGHKPVGEATRFRPGRKESPAEKVRRLNAQSRVGYKHDEAARAKIADAARKQHAQRRAAGIKPPRGWKHTPETRARMSEAVRRRDITGARNPFYGRKHTPEARAKMGFPSGEAHPGYRNGASTLPYGPEFTKKFKRMIRDRDNHTCQRCSKTREEIGRTLDVHHIDHDHFNNDPRNLTTVCHACNVWLTWHPEITFIPLNQH